MDNALLFPNDILEWKAQRWSRFHSNVNLWKMTLLVALSQRDVSLLIQNTCVILKVLWTWTKLTITIDVSESLTSFKFILIIICYLFFVSFATSSCFILLLYFLNFFFHFVANSSWRSESVYSWIVPNAIAGFLSRQNFNFSA